MAREARSRPSVHRGARGSRADPRVLDHRWKVDLVDVTVPVDDAGIEAEQLAVCGAQPVPELEKPVDPEQRFGLGVGAVELDVPEGAFCESSPLLNPGGEVRALSTHRKCAEQPLGETEREVGALRAGAGLDHARGTTSPARRSAARRCRRSGDP